MIYKSFHRGGECLQAGKKPKMWEKVCGGGLSFINSPAVAATPSWMVNQQWPQNYRHCSPADSKNCLLTAIYGPAFRAGPPLSLVSPRCAHILTSWRHCTPWLTSSLAHCELFEGRVSSTASLHLPEVSVEDIQIGSKRQQVPQITGKVTDCVRCCHTGFIEYYTAEHESGRVTV